MSVDHTAMQIALRTRLLALTLATTGSTTLSATATGYARTAGSFYTDGFWAGMEFTAAGFGTSANNGTGVVKDVTPLTMTVMMYATSTTNGVRTVTYPANVVEAAAPGRSLTVGLPSNRAWENSAYTPIAGIPYVEEQYVPGPAAMEHDGYAGLLELRPMSCPRIYVPSGSGISADGRYADAILQLFAPGTTLAVTGGAQLVVHGKPAPYRGPRAQAASPGWSCIPVNIPLRCTTISTPS